MDFGKINATIKVNQFIYLLKLKDTVARISHAFGRVLVLIKDCALSNRCFPI